MAPFCSENVSGVYIEYVRNTSYFDFDMKDHVIHHCCKEYNEVFVQQWNSIYILADWPVGLVVRDPDC